VVGDPINTFLGLLGACNDDSIALWPSVFMEFHIVTDLHRNGRWSQIHGAGGGDADRWGAGEGVMTMTMANDDGDECLMCGFTRLD
jgi:hypothetical protein